jgi:hypothetical protein
VITAGNFSLLASTERLFSTCIHILVTCWDATTPPPLVYFRVKEGGGEKERMEDSREPEEQRRSQAHNAGSCPQATARGACPLLVRGAIAALVVRGDNGTPLVYYCSLPCRVRAVIVFLYKTSRFLFLANCIFPFTIYLSVVDVSLHRSFIIIAPFFFPF